MLFGTKSTGLVHLLFSSFLKSEILYYTKLHPVYVITDDDLVTFFNALPNMMDLQHSECIYWFVIDRMITL